MEVPQLQFSWVCRPVLAQGCCWCNDRGRAMLGLTVSRCSASVLGWLLGDFHDFLREGVHSDPEVDYVLLFSPVEVATFVVNNGSDMIVLVLMVSMHLMLCS